MIIVCWHYVHKACTYPCTYYMHESCTYLVIVIVMSPARILVSEVFTCHAHHCEWIIFILDAYCHCGDRTHKHQNWWFHQGLNTVHAVCAAESWPTTLVLYTNDIKTIYTKQNFIFQHFLLSVTFFPFNVVFWRFFDRFVIWVIFNLHLLMHISVIYWKVASIKSTFSKR